MGTSGHVFERLPGRDGHPQHSSRIQRIWHHILADGGLTYSGNTMVAEREMRREPQNSSIPVPRFQRGGGILHHVGGTYSHGGMIDYPGFPISELHLGKFPRLNGISKLESQLQD